MSQENGAGLMQACVILYNACFAFSQVCSTIFVFIHYDQYLHDTPGHTILFRVVEIYSSEFGLKLELDMGLGNSLV